MLLVGKFQHCRHLHLMFHCSTLVSKGGSRSDLKKVCSSGEVGVCESNQEAELD